MGEVVTSGISAAPVATVVVGNPRLASRTAAAAVAVARGVLRHAGFGDGEVTLIELSQLGSGLLTGADPAVSAAKGSVLASDLLVSRVPRLQGVLLRAIEGFP